MILTLRFNCLWGFLLFCLWQVPTRIWSLLFDSLLFSQEIIVFFRTFDLLLQLLKPNKIFMCRASIEITIPIINNFDLNNRVSTCLDSMLAWWMGLWLSSKNNLIISSFFPIENHFWVRSSPPPQLIKNIMRVSLKLCDSSIFYSSSV